jgi:hypothetical protein
MRFVGPFFELKIVFFFVQMRKTAFLGVCKIERLFLELNRDLIFLFRRGYEC